MAIKSTETCPRCKAEPLAPCVTPKGKLFKFRGKLTIHMARVWGR